MNLQLTIAACLLLISKKISASVFSNTLTNPYLIPPFNQPGDPGVTQYLVFHSALSANYTSARARCRTLGGDLADVESVETLNYLASRLHDPAFVASWLGSNMGFACMAVFPGGAIAVPEGGCVGRIGSICEVPIFSTASIHIGAQPDSTSNLSQDFPEARAALIKDPQPIDNAEDIRIYRDGKRVIGARPEGKTATMTIYGSIATNPVLPCCQCC